MASIKLNAALSMAKRFFDDLTRMLSFLDEVDESPPRARIALVTARFEERLSAEILRRLVVAQGASSLDELDTKTRKVLLGIVARRPASFLNELGCALGVYPYETLSIVGRILKLRNQAIHQTEALTKKTQEEIEKGVLFMRVMEFYLANVGSIGPQDGPYLPPSWEDAEDLFSKRNEKQNG